MIKIRLEGLPDDCQKAAEALKESFTIYQTSGFYRNRGGQFGRVYIDADPIRSATSPADGRKQKKGSNNQ